jgi:hypothetical protein
MKHAKEKGSRLERKIAQKIRLSGLDKEATRMVLSGAAFGLETDIRTKLPYAFECKNQETVKLWAWWEQAEKGRKPFKPPVLVVGGNYRPQLAVMLFDDWLNILKEVEDLKHEV